MGSEAGLLLGSRAPLVFFPKSLGTNGFSCLIIPESIAKGSSVRSPWTSYIEPSYIEPSYIEPSYIEPSYIEPSYIDT